VAHREPEFDAVVADLTARVDRLRLALRACLDSVLPDLGGARACGRALGLKRDLGWKVYALATSTDLPAALKVLPRQSGWELILDRLARSRCPAAALVELRAIVAEVERSLGGGTRGVRGVRRIDRPLLRAMAAGGLDTARESAAMAKARRAVRQGNEEIYGIRAEAMIGTFVIGLPDAKRRIDLVGSLHYEGLRRLRPGPPFPLHRSMLGWHPDWKEPRSGKPLAHVGSLVADLSRLGDAAHAVRVQTEDDFEITYLHGGTTRDRTGLRALFIDHLRKAGTVGEADDRAELDLNVSAPTVRAVFEVWIPVGIARITEPTAALVGSFTRTYRPGETTDILRLPLEAEAKPIDDPALSGPLRGASAAHEAIVERSLKLLGGRRADYRGYRVVVPDPPIGSLVKLLWRM